MKAVDILGRIYPFDDPVWVNMGRQGQLNQKSVNLIVVIQEIDGFEKLLLGDILRQSVHT